MDAKNKIITCEFCSKQINFYVRKRHYTSISCRQHVTKQELEVNCQTLASLTQQSESEVEILRKKLKEVQAGKDHIEEEIVRLQERLETTRRDYDRELTKWQMACKKLVVENTLLKNRMASRSGVLPLDRDGIVTDAYGRWCGVFGQRRPHFQKCPALLTVDWVADQIDRCVLATVIDTPYAKTMNIKDCVLGYTTILEGELLRDSNHTVGALVAQCTVDMCTLCVECIYADPEPLQMYMHGEPLSKERAMLALRNRVLKPAVEWSRAIAPRATSSRAIKG